MLLRSFMSGKENKLSREVLSCFAVDVQLLAEVINRMINVGLSPDVNLTVCNIVFMRAIEKLNEMGFDLEDTTRDTSRYLNLVRTSVVCTAASLYIHCRMTDEDERQGAILHSIVNVQDYLVSSVEISVNCLTLMAMVIVDPIELLIAKAFYEIAEGGEEEEEEEEQHINKWYSYTDVNMGTSKQDAGIIRTLILMLTIVIRRHIETKYNMSYQDSAIKFVLDKMMHKKMLHEETKYDIMKVQGCSVMLRAKYVHSVKDKTTESILKKACEYAITHKYMPEKERIVTGFNYIGANEEDITAPHLLRVWEFTRPEEYDKAIKIKDEIIDCELNEFAMRQHLKATGFYRECADNVGWQKGDDYRLAVICAKVFGKMRQAMTNPSLYKTPLAGRDNELYPDYLMGDGKYKNTNPAHKILSMCDDGADKKVKTKIDWSKIANMEYAKASTYIEEDDSSEE
jgi:hypothetical protein